MRLEEIIEQTIATIRTSKNMELRMAANEHPERTMTLEEVADALDQALEEASQALMDVVGDEDQDERSEPGSWWQGYHGHPYDWRRDAMPEEGLLPRTSSWWNGCF